MRTLQALVAALLLQLLLLSSAHAGGSIPEGWGSQAPANITIPASSSTIRWDYYGVMTDLSRETIMWAVATMDIETLKYRLLYGKAVTELAGEPWTIMRFRGIDAGPDAGCTDSIPHNCEYADTTCLASTVAAGRRLCTLWRVDLEIANMRTALDPGETLEEFMHAVIRHEVGHVLGLWHDGEGPMANGNLPLTPCQLAKLDLYHNDPSIPTWTFLPVPECD